MSKMWCLVSQPNSYVVEVEVEQKAKGQEVLQKVCDLLGIKAETDYFGLKYSGAKGVETWLNLRNPVERQAAGQQPYRFQLRVKFWVPPHLVLQDSTRHQMYLQVRVDLSEERLVPGESSGTCCEGRTKLAALLVQAEVGDHPAPQWLYDKWAQVLALPEASLPHHHSLIQGMKSSVAEYWVLKEVSSWDNFGEEVFTSKGVKLGIGPHGINIYQPSELRIPYTGIKSASSLKRVFQLYYYNIEHEEALLEAKCDSCQAASNLYRALTERHAFYSCDTVRNAVTSQCIRDLKGTIVSIFNESSPLGKKYVFDIRRTCREVHDNARRALYDGGSKQESAEAQSASGEEGSTTADKLTSLIDALTCRICMDAGIDTVFFPCAHVISCNSCAVRCQSCPLCRSDIETAKRVYLPTSQLGLIS